MKFLKDFRRENGLSREEMAKKMGVSLSFYDKIEFGTRTPSKNFLNKFKQAFPAVDMNIFFDNKLHE